MIKEVSMPYIVNPDDEAVGRETVIIRRNGEPVAAIVPYAEYQQLVESRQEARPDVPEDPEFERNRAAFHRLLPELLKDHRGEWVAIVDEKPAQFGSDFQSVIVPVREQFGQRPIYVQEILETPRIYRMPSVRVVR